MLTKLASLTLTLCAVSASAQLPEPTPPPAPPSSAPRRPLLHSGDSEQPLAPEQPGLGDVEQTVTAQPVRPDAVASVETTETHRIYPLVVIGPVMAAVGWGVSIASYFASVQCHPSFFIPDCTSASAWLLLPQVGPWLALTSPNTASKGMTGQVIALGVTQAAGLALMVVGLTVKVPSMAAPTTSRSEVRLQVAVGAPGAPAGLTLTGAFL